MPTLLEDLEHAARDYDTVADSNVWVTQKWGPGESRNAAARLRAAAVRLRAAMEYNEHERWVRMALEQVNGGPL